MPEPEQDDDGRPRAFWSGLLSFGLVSIPVDLFPAHHAGRSPLRMLDADGTPLARRYFCPADAEEVDRDHLVRGYELDNGKIVMVSDEELEALAPKKSREIALSLFVDRDSIDPLYFERAYFLAPGADSGKAYRLLTAVMERSRRAGIASFVMRDREYLIAIYADGGLLRGETLRFAGEVRSARQVGLPKPSTPEPKVLKKVRDAVAKLSQSRWNPADLEEVQDAVRKLAERKHRRHQDVMTSEPDTAEAGAQVIDLMEVLKRSLAESGLTSKSRSGKKAGRTAKNRTSRRAQASRKSPKSPPAKRAAGARG